MKYNPKIYAKAFSQVAAGPLNKDKERQLINNFLAAIRRNNDVSQLKKIFEETEKILRAKSGRRKITLESGRHLSNLQGKLKNFLKKDDIVEGKINPELIAGVKITVDEGEQFDGSLKWKLDKLFS